MKNTSCLLLFACIVLFSRCVDHAYFLSAFNANSNPYHAIPLQSDSVKGATYVSGDLTIGGANENLRDNIIAFRGSIHRANTFGNFHLYYGANASIGSYNVSNTFDESSNYSYTLQTGGKLFGGYGFNGGFNALIPLRNGGEWRVIGVEGSAQREFGDYLDFRKNVPDSAVSVVYKNDWVQTIGITTEFVAKRRSGATIGYKLGIGTGLNNLKYTYQNTSRQPPVYVSNTLHFGRDNWIAFMQVNFGTYAANFQFGVNYKLGKKK